MLMLEEGIAGDRYELKVGRVEYAHQDGPDWSLARWPKDVRDHVAAALRAVDGDDEAVRAVPAEGGARTPSSPDLAAARAVGFEFGDDAMEAVQQRLDRLLLSPVGEENLGDVLQLLCALGILRQSDVIQDERVAHERVDNPEFVRGREFWEG